MKFDDAVTFVQRHFTDGLALVIGSGLSVAEGMPGMPELASSLAVSARALNGDTANEWAKIQEQLDDVGLEGALLNNPPSEVLEQWIAYETCGLLLPRERQIVAQVFNGACTLRITKFLNRVLKPAGGLPNMTTNYDRLVEVGREAAGLHVDTTAVGQYAGLFDHERSCMASCKGITARGRITVLNHFPRAIVLKPHGSFDWYQMGNGPRHCSLDLDSERLIITPGLNKYRAGYDSPFDKHRELANDFINRASRLLVVGYGFNDDHLQTHLIKRISDQIPTLVMNMAINDTVLGLTKTSSNCIALSKPDHANGVVITAQDGVVEEVGADLWDLGVLVEELLA